MARLPSFRRRGKRPLYVQVRDYVLRCVARGTFGPGGKLPSERALAGELGVSRITVRNAYRLLLDEGHLHKGRKAYVVSRPFDSEGLLMLGGFTAESAWRGRAPRTEVLSLEAVAPSNEVRRFLALSESEGVLRLVRKRSHGDEAVAIEHCHLAANRFAGVARERDLSSLYRVLRERYGVHVKRAEQTFGMAPVPAEVRRMLGVRKGAPVLVLRRISYSQRNEPVEYVVGYYDAAGREFYVEVR